MQFANQDEKTDQEKKQIMWLEWKHVSNCWQILMEGRSYMREHKMNAKTVLGQFIKLIRWHFVGTSATDVRADEYGEVTFLKQQSVTRFH